MKIVKAPESENVERKITNIETSLANKIEPVMKSYLKDIDLTNILEHDRLFLILTVNGQNSSETIGNISILAEHWGKWTLTCMTKNDVMNNGQMYPSFGNNILSVPQSYGWSYTVIFKF